MEKDRMCELCKLRVVSNFVSLGRYEVETDADIDFEDTDLQYLVCEICFSRICRSVGGVIRLIENEIRF